MLYQSNAFSFFHLERHVKEDVNKPFECGMIPSVQCSGVIGIWSKGMTGECMHESTGFKIGPNGFKKGALQVIYLFISACTIIYILLPLISV